jgi:hypothetical protein
VKTLLFVAAASAAAAGTDDWSNLGFALGKVVAAAIITWTICIALGLDKSPTPPDDEHYV